MPVESYITNGKKKLIKKRNIGADGDGSHGFPAFRIYLRWMLSAPSTKSLQIGQAVFFMRYDVMQNRSRINLIFTPTLASPP
jgi:hypothetical protein